MKNLLNYALLASAFTGSALVADAQNPIVIQAEDFDYGYKVLAVNPHVTIVTDEDGNQTEVPLPADEDLSQIDGLYLGGDGDSSPGIGSYDATTSGEGGIYAMWNVNVPVAGTYDLTIYYATYFDRWLRLTFNQQESTIVYCKETTAGWTGNPGMATDEDGTLLPDQDPAIAKKTVKVYLEAGDNTMRIDSFFGWSTGHNVRTGWLPNLDKFEFVKSDTEIAEPAVWDNYLTIVREMEDADGKAGSTTCPDNRGDMHGGAGACIGGGGGSLTYNVNVAEAGVYNLTLWYGLFGTRYTKIKVNYGEPYELMCRQWGSCSWQDANSHTNVLIDLQAGDNTITFMNFTKTGDNASDNADTAPMDVFTLDKVRYDDYEAPKNEIAAPFHSLSRVAVYTSDELRNVETALKDRDEWTLAEADGNQATLTLEFPWPIVMTAYSFGTTADISKWTLQVSNDGQSWSNAPSGEKGSVGAITTFTMMNPFNPNNLRPFKYIRVNIDGDVPASIGDFSVWGYPYIDGVANNPDGLINIPAFEGEAVADEEKGNIYPNYWEDLAAYYQDFYTVSNNGYTNIDHPADPITGEPGVFYADETTHKIFDNDNSTFWTPVGVTAYDENTGEGGVTVELWLEEPAQVQSYLIAVPYRVNAETGVAQFTERNPKNWMLEALDENGDFAAIDEIKNFNWYTIGAAYILPVAQDFESDYYRFTLKDGGTLQLSELQLFTDNYSGLDSSVNEVLENAVAVSIERGAISFSANEGTAYGIYSINGMNVASGKASANGNTVALNPGLYVVRIGNIVKKVVIR